ncbi:hypothetical protein [Methylophaga sulfidovorans]|uniref:Uncharacterized protein n=1 Tax=Methylophaga sulfidovorans TaxID=45496 RepID=A0A1I3U9N8_9GAMM|nr:hypothetical protein [Methylophaga sulfidovorans]SFJ80288.1 hypothetical protein SAMN04488079_101262 [Methylophaga sulfidovorans]
MASFKAIVVMVFWTALVGYGLYSVGAQDNFRDPLWAVGIGLALLITHMVNMAIYFKVAGEKPFQWPGSVNS